MIAETDVTADPALRRLIPLLLRQGADFDRLAASPPTEAAVHRLRVLTRRMRAACSLVRRMAPSVEAARTLARRLRKAGRALGERRTLDVAASDYSSLSGGRKLPNLSLRKSAADADLARMLRAKRRRAVAGAVRDLVESLRSAEPEPRAVDAFLRSRLDRLREGLGAVTKKELHGLRIAAKKVRYALETARTLGRDRRAPLERALKRVQRRLGRMHDFESLRGFLPERDPVGIRAAAREAALRAGVRSLAAALRAALSGDGRRP